MNELEERARRVLDVARSRHEPSAVDVARVRSALRARVAADPKLLEQPMSAPLGRALPGKLLVVFGAGGVAGFAAGLYVASALAPAAVAPPFEPAPSRDGANVAAESGRAAAQRPETAAQGGLAPNEAPRAETSAEPSVPSPVLSPVPSRAKPPAVTSGGASRLKAELDGLRRAQELLHQGQPAWALARLTELDRAEVGSVLLEERLATRAIAECMLGKDAEEQTAEFSRRFPRSAHLESVRSSCAKVVQTGSAAQNPASKQTETRGPRHE